MVQEQKIKTAIAEFLWGKVDFYNLPKVDNQKVEKLLKGRYLFGFTASDLLIILSAILTLIFLQIQPYLIPYLEGRLDLFTFKVIENKIIEEQVSEKSLDAVSKVDKSGNLISDQIQETASARNLKFTGNNTYTEVDNNGDGFFEALLVNVEVQTSTSGEYSIFGVLQKGGTNIANRSSFESMLFTTAQVTTGSTTRKVDITFSGEQIFRSGQDGPYDLFLSGIGPNNESAQEIFLTPTIIHTQYGEVQVFLTGATDSAIDIDNDGYFEFVNVAVDVNVRVAEDFFLQGDFSKDYASVAGAGSAFNLESGMHTVDLQFPGSELRQSGKEGPYDGTVNLLDATGHTLQSLIFATQAYTSDSFSTVLYRAD